MAAEGVDVDLEREAEEGKADAQVKLANYYLKLAEAGGDTLMNARLAVTWFIKASRQGFEEATDKLKDCLSKQFGVDESNLCDVKWCISTPRHERVAREAARRLFLRITQPFGNNNSISKADFALAVEGITAGKIQKKMLLKAGKNKDGSDQITEEVFVNKMFKRLQGQGGMTFNSLLQNDVEWEAYYNATVYEKATKYPGKSFAWVADSTIELVGSQGRQWIKSIIPVNQIYMLIILFIYSLISAESVLWFIPILTFWISYISMLISTMQMFYSRRKLLDVKALAEMLEEFSDQFEQEGAESTFSWNSLCPYISFFFALLTMLLSYSAADRTWIACSELTVISMVVTVACFLALSDCFDYLALCSIVLDFVPTVASVVQYVIRNWFWAWFASLTDYILGNIISIQLLPNFYIELGLPSLVYLVVPILFLRMAMIKSWSGTYRILIPHLVCFFWWRVVMMFFSSSTWLGLGRGSMGWVLFLVALPFLACGLIAYIIYIIVSFFSFSTLLKIIMTVILIVVIAVFAAWSKGGFKVGNNFNMDKKSIGMNFLFFALVVIVLCAPFSSLISPEDFEGEVVYLDWDVYRASCGPEAWRRSSVADASNVCSHFVDAKVNWSGYIKQTRIKQSENQAEKFIDSLPDFVANRFRCVYGEAYAADCETLNDVDDKRICVFNKERGRNCHVKNLNRNTYEMSVNMAPDDAEIKLVAPHYFSNIALELRPGDQVQFGAFLVDNLGGVGPGLRLYRLQCTTCENPQKVYGRSVLGQTGWTILVELQKSLEHVWNFFLAPIMQFK